MHHCFPNVLYNVHCTVHACKRGRTKIFFSFFKNVWGTWCKSKSLNISATLASKTFHHIFFNILKDLKTLPIIIYLLNLVEEKKGFILFCVDQKRLGSGAATPSLQYKRREIARPCVFNPLNHLSSLQAGQSYTGTWVVSSL